MNRLNWAFSLLVVAGASAVVAQPPEGRGGPEGGPGRGGPGGGGQMRPSPLVEALDADHDGTISADEIKNASAALLSLDKDKDGKLAGEEFRPAAARAVQVEGLEDRAEMDLAVLEGPAVLELAVVVRVDQADAVQADLRVANLDADLAVEVRVVLAVNVVLAAEGLMGHHLLLNRQIQNVCTSMRWSPRC